MKKIVVILMCFSIAISLSACSKEQKTEEKPQFLSINNANLSIPNLKLLFYATEKYEIKLNSDISKDFWKLIVDTNNKTTYAEYQKEVVFFENVKYICALSAMFNEDNTLSEDEISMVNKMAADYYYSMNENDIAMLNTNLTEIEDLFTLYYKAIVVENKYISDFQAQVSEEEYRVCIVEKLQFRNTSDATQYYEQYSEDPDVADDNLIIDSAIMNVDKESEITEGQLTTIFSLDNNELSGIFATDNGCVIYKMINKFDIDLSNQRKENILTAQKKASWQTVCKKYLSTAKSFYNESEWKKLSFMTQDSFSSRLAELFDSFSKIENYSLTRVTPESEGIATRE